MRRTVLLMILGSVLIWAGFTYLPASEPDTVITTSNPFPVDFRCMHSSEAELELCGELGAAFLNTGDVVFDVDESRPFFRVVVLPTERDGYYSVTIVSGFFYPPLDGLALSAYFMGVIIEPDGMTEENMNVLARSTVTGMSKWLLASGEQILGLCENRPKGLEASYD